VGDETLADLLDRLSSALSDRYAIEREIGRGGMAVVYLAEDLKHHRRVAIKVLQPGLAATLGTERFLREIETVASLQHPHILPLYDSGEADTFLYFVMPYVEGENLRDRLKGEEQLDVDEALRLTREIADALAYAHRQGLVHRDIKPGNVLLSEGHAIVADFGIARALAEAGGEELTATGMSVGSPRYMSPEQAIHGREIDSRSDIYSLGCVLYEMLVGQPPFAHATPQASLMRRAVERPPGPRSLRPDVPEAVDAAVTRALAPLPDDRYGNVKEFSAALGAAAGAVSRLPGRSRAIWVAAVATLVVLAVAWLVSARQGRGGGLEAVAALAEVEALIGDNSYAEAYRRAKEITPDVSDDSLRNEIWSAVTVSGPISSEPPGAAVWMRPYNSTGADWDSVGVTPLELRAPRGAVRLRLELEGYPTRHIVTREWGGHFSAEDLVLDPVGSIPDGMTRVRGGQFSVWLPSLEQLEIELPDYFIDAYEVTNRQFKEFVDAGGYQDQKYWTEPFAGDGREIAWKAGIAEFTDRTGRPGPSKWEVGSYPSGEGDLPVGGVSWYEAAAYARFVGKELPTVYHWYWAAYPPYGDFILPRSNFSRNGAAPGGRYDGISRWGAYDMAGNVREWCYNATGEKRFLLGGGWDDPAYMFTDANAQSPLDRSATNGIRLMKVLDEKNLEVARGPIERPSRDYFSEDPVSDEIFDVYLRMYAYDAVPLKSVTEGSDTTDLWVREEISMDAAYGGERLTVFLYVPRSRPPPYQTVLYFPGSNVIGAATNQSVDRYVHTFDFFLKSGRALIYPVFKGTFARSTELRSDIQDESTLWREHVIAWARDVGRSIDYLETRDDIALEKGIGYFGFSWGSAVAPIMLAIDERFRAAVLLSGGLLQHPTQPEVDPFNFLPRVWVPTLMINVPNDFFYPLESAQRPMFHYLGTAGTVKDSVLVDGGHLPPLNVVTRETLDWFDRYLGPVE
jgi:tRNA A-37 threonylcarbamoyl transferase component Bud32